MSSRSFPFTPGSAPFWDAYLHSLDSVKHSFAIPGHKGRIDVLGPMARWDRPISLSNRRDIPSFGLLSDAEAAAAQLWGATHCRFSVNGSSAANQAAVAAVAGPGDHVISSRAIHKSLLFGFIQAGVTPLWLPPSLDAYGLPGPTDPAMLSALLDRYQEVKAVFIGSPTYVGTFSDVGALAGICHERGVPLVIDAAWGGHFGFHPDLPPNPLSQGADIMVLSAHKTLPTLTQGAMIHMCGDRISRERLDRVFDATQTTSPAAAIAASMDAARAFLAEHGEETLGALLSAVTDAREFLSSIPAIDIPSGPTADPIKLIIRGKAGFSGLALEERLNALGLEVETADHSTLIPQITMADTPDDIARLTRSISASVGECTGHKSLAAPQIWSVTPVQRMPPREAFYAAHVSVPRDAAIGQISGELISPYPPGIPILAPGEEITHQALDALDAAASAGIRIAYATDPTLANLVVVLPD